MRHGGQDQVVIGQAGRPVTANHAHGDVLVDDDHGELYWSVDVGQAVAAEVGVFGGDPVQLSLEGAHQIAGGQSAEDLSSLRGDTGVTGPAAASAFLEQFLTDTHAHQSAAGL